MMVARERSVRVGANRVDDRSMVVMASHRDEPGRLPHKFGRSQTPAGGGFQVAVFPNIPLNPGAIPSTPNNIVELHSLLDDTGDDFLACSGNPQGF
jgi:hypothetical protein